MAGFAGLTAKACCFIFLLTYLFCSVPLTKIIFYELALPGDPSLDVFSSGNERVDQYFRNREWYRERQASPPTYVFRTAEKGETIGYCAVGFRNQKDPNSQGASKVKYLVVYMLGVRTEFQGKENALAPGQTYANSIMFILEGMARSKEGCIGLTLWVRSNNERGIGFYRKVGFEVDPACSGQFGEGEPMLTMRKLLT